VDSAVRRELESEGHEHHELQVGAATRKGSCTRTAVCGPYTQGGYKQQGCSAAKCSHSRDARLADLRPLAMRMHLEVGILATTVCAASASVKAPIMGNGVLGLPSLVTRLLPTHEQGPGSALTAP
jgi:hypothetical protein